MPLRLSDIPENLGIWPRRRHVTDRGPIARPKSRQWVGDGARVRGQLRGVPTGRRRGRPSVEMKMAAEVRWLLVFLVTACGVSSCRGESPHRKFEYKYSFKPPYLAQRDGSVPFWEYGGSKFTRVLSVRRSV